MSDAVDPLFEYLLRLGDGALILGHRLSEWVGHAPALEEELALANVSLDLIGQATLWLALAGEVEGRGRDADRLAYHRDAAAFRNPLLVEQPNGDYARTLARQFYYDHWHALLLDGLSRSADPRVAEIAAKAAVEVRYHCERSADWTIRLGDGTDESRRRMQQAVDRLWPYTGELFIADAVDGALLASGVGVDLAALRAPWRRRVDAVFDQATLTLPGDDWCHRGGRQGVHSEHLGYLLAEMQFLPRAYPDASW